MKYHELRPNKEARQERRRVGRGMGSGRGKTAGAGTKGQTARSGGAKKAPFIGGAFPLTRTMPYKKGFKNPFRVAYAVVSVGALDKAFESGAAITPQALKDAGLVRARERRPVKLLSDGETTKRLIVEIDRASAGARAKIEVAGGTLTETRPREEKQEPAKKRAPRAAADETAESVAETASPSPEADATPDADEE